jgi:hypothetical protein
MPRDKPRLCLRATPEHSPGTIGNNRERLTARHTGAAPGSHLGQHPHYSLRQECRDYDDICISHPFWVPNSRSNERRAMSRTNLEACRKDPTL